MKFIVFKEFLAEVPQDKLYFSTVDLISLAGGMVIEFAAQQTAETFPYNLWNFMRPYPISTSQ